VYYPKTSSVQIRLRFRPDFSSNPARSALALALFKIGEPGTFGDNHTFLPQSVVVRNDVAG